MIAVMLSEIVGWLKNQSRMTLTLLWIIFGIAGGFSLLRPEFCLEILTAFVIWLATKAGNQSWSEFWVRDWVKRTNLPLRTVVIGKVFASLGVCLFHLAAVFPILIMMLILWGFTWMQLLNIILLNVVSASIVIGLSLCGSSLEGTEADFLTGFPVAVWLILTALIPMLRPLNPFYKTWEIMVSNPSSLWGINLINLGLAVSAIGLAEYLFRRRSH